MHVPLPRARQAPGTDTTRAPPWTRPWLSPALARGRRACGLGTRQACGPAAATAPSAATQRALPWASLGRQQTCLQVLCCGLSALEATRRIVSAAAERHPPPPRARCPGARAAQGPRTRAAPACVRIYGRLQCLDVVQARAAGAHDVVGVELGIRHVVANTRVVALRRATRQRPRAGRRWCVGVSGRERGSSSEREPGRHRLRRSTQAQHVARRKRPRLRLRAAPGRSVERTGSARARSTEHGTRMHACTPRAHWGLRRRARARAQAHSRDAGLEDTYSAGAVGVTRLGAPAVGLVEALAAAQGHKAVKLHGHTLGLSHSLTPPLAATRAGGSLPI